LCLRVDNILHNGQKTNIIYSCVIKLGYYRAY